MRRGDQPVTPPAAILGEVPSFSEPVDCRDDVASLNMQARGKADVAHCKARLAETRSKGQYGQLRNALEAQPINGNRYIDMGYPAHPLDSFLPSIRSGGFLPPHTQL